MPLEIGFESMVSGLEKKLDKNFVDPKFEKFQEKLEEELARDDKRKVLIFSEFADTANYIYKKLRNNNFNR